MLSTVNSHVNKCKENVNYDGVMWLNMTSQGFGYTT